MSDLFGYHGRYWRLRLPRAEIEPVALAPEVYRCAVGGVGLAAWLLARECPPGADPLSADSPLVLAWGPLAGLGLAGADRFCIAGKSPLTHRLNDALCASEFGAAGRGLGADAVLISGGCAELSVLQLGPGQATVLPWPALAGLSAAEAEAVIRGRLGSSFQVAAIGPAGERQVAFANLSAAGRHAGRGGTGAVLGARGLKAIAIEPGEPPPVADSAALAHRRKTLAERQRQGREAGDTLRHLAPYAARGVLPGRNFGAPAEPALGRQLTGGVRGGVGGERIEYESAGSLGPLCGLEDAGIIRQAAARCDELGLDTISTGVTLAFAMDCAERGIVLPPPLAALGLRFGNSEAVLAALEAISGESGGTGSGADPHRTESAGALLGGGTRRLAQRLGPAAEAIAPHVKGLELPAYDPRAVPTLALALAVGARGADHNKSSAYDADLGETGGAAPAASGPETLARAVIEAEHRAAVLDSLILSKFLRREVDAVRDLPALLAAVTGWRPQPAQLQRIGSAIADDRKHFNQRQGWRANEDTLPARFFDEPGPASPPLDRARFREAVAAYYRLRGWDAAGRVSGD